MKVAERSGRRALIVIVTALAVPGLRPALADAYFDQGVRLFQQRNYKGAAPYFEESMRSSQFDSSPYYYAALNYHYMADWTKAKAAYRLVVQKFPGTDACRLASAALAKIDPGWRPPAQASGNLMPAASAAVSASPDLASLPNEARVYFQSQGTAMVVDTEVNNRPVKMVFDTGAPGILLGKNQLAEVGIAPPAGGATGFTGGSSSGASAATWSMNADVKLGAIVRKNFPITVIENNQSQPLLGQDFFRDFEYSIDSGSKSILFKKKGSTAARPSRPAGGISSDTNSVPFTWDKIGGNKMVVNVEINGRSYPCWLDTGNSAVAISMNKRDARNLGISIPEDAQQAMTGGITGAGSASRFPVRRVKFGPIDKTDVDVDVKEEDTGGRPLLGQPLLEGWQVTIDNDNMRVKFLRR